MPGWLLSNRSFRVHKLRIIFEAAQQLASQGTPRRWFSPLAIAHEIDRWGGSGYAKEHDFLRLAFIVARMVIRHHRRAREVRHAA